MHFYKKCTQDFILNLKGIFVMGGCPGMFVTGVFTLEVYVLIPTYLLMI